MCKKQTTHDAQKEILRGLISSLGTTYPNIEIIGNPSLSEKGVAAEYRINRDFKNTPTIDLSLGTTETAFGFKKGELADPLTIADISENPKRLTIVLSHEIGHHVSSLAGNRTQRYERASIAYGDGEPISLADLVVLVVEECRAWGYAAPIMRKNFPVYRRLFLISALEGVVRSSIRYGNAVLKQPRG